MTQDYREQISQEDILEAIETIDRGEPNDFGPSTFYDLLHNGRRYPPKAVVGLAARRVLGRALRPDEFAAGQESWSFRLLRDRGFEVVQKAHASARTLLPAQFPKNVWIETTKTSEHAHGGTGWEFGTCLWSPATNAAGNDTYSLMKEPRPGDLVIHINNGSFAGSSYVATECKEVTEEPPQAGPWAGRGSYYRIDLRDYTPFPRPLSVSSFVENAKEGLHKEMSEDSPSRFPFILYGQQQEVRSAQGAYITRCTANLYKLIQAQLDVGSSPRGSASSEPRFWIMSVGEGGRLWNEFQEAAVVAIGWDDFALGDLMQYPSRDAIQQELVNRSSGTGPTPSNDALCLFQFSHEMRVGDFIVAKLGRRKLLGLGQLTSDYYYDQDRSEYRHCRHVHWLRSHPVDLSEHQTLAPKTLTDATPYPDFISFVREVYLQTDVDTQSHSASATFTEEEALATLFISAEQFGDILRSLRRKKNVILQGPPGVGKTFAARQIAMALVGERDSSRVELVQFHQSYSYEDFVQGWRPRSEGGFRLKNGIFFEFCGRARIDTGKPHVFVIDEINRGNLSRIFGELMMLMEADKRGSKFAIPLTYSEHSGERFSIPENVHIIGLMNTADRSLAMVDYALRRRFIFFTLSPAFESAKFKSMLSDSGASQELVERICRGFRALNQQIAEDSDLGIGFQVGHSYFCPTAPGERLDEDWFRSIIETEVAPLLREYWFDKSAAELDAVVSRFLSSN